MLKEVLRGADLFSDRLRSRASRPAAPGARRQVCRRVLLVDGWEPFLKEKCSCEPSAWLTSSANPSANLSATSTAFWLLLSVKKGQTARQMEQAKSLRLRALVVPIFWAHFSIFWISRQASHSVSAMGDHSLPSSRSTTQHPLQCSPGWRQWAKMSALVQPASSRASARMGMRAKARSV